MDLKSDSNERSPLLAKSGTESVEAHVQRAKAEKPFLHVIAVVLPVALILTGIAVLHVAEGWPLVTCVYVMVQIVTTIGYGDFTVTHTGTKIFMGIYVILALIILAYYFNKFVSGMVEGESSAMTSYLQRLEDEQDDEVDTTEAAERKYGDLNNAIVGTLAFFMVLSAGVVFYRFFEHCSCSYGLGRVSGCDDSSGFDTCAASGGYVKGFADAFYMSSITLTTIGFGDYQPRTVEGRLFGIAWMLIGVASTGMFLSSVSTYFFESERKAFYDQRDMVSSLDREEFNKIDRDGNGTLSKGEYLAYTLVKYTGVSEECIEEIMKEYSRIDKGGTNAVTWEMLHQRQKEIVAKRASKATADDVRLPSA